MNYTRGEWKVTSNTFVYALNKRGHNRFAANVQPGVDDEETRTSDTELRANARLIAASPKLLGVVEQFIRYCDQWQRANGDFPNGDGRILILKNAKDTIQTLA